MLISATVSNTPSSHEVQVCTEGTKQSLAVSPRPNGRGSSVNGGEFLMLALATCYCNDLFREAARLGLVIESAEVEASAEFPGIGLAATNVRYTAKVQSPASEHEIAKLLEETDAVAEVHNTLRTGVPVELRRTGAAMTPDVTVSLDDLEAALDWVSAGGALENRAFISKENGAAYYASDEDFGDMDTPEDIDDATRYWSVPHKNDLDLGRSLVFQYISESLPDDYETVRAYFHRRGAYSQFKELLRHRGHLDRWHEYEHQATRQALVQWAEECGFRVVGSSPKPAGA